MSVSKIKCVHEKDGKSCIGTLSFLYKGNVYVLPSSEVTEEVVDNCNVVIEDKCNYCKRKTVILIKVEQENQTT